jgi:hypothetical protein
MTTQTQDTHTQDPIERFTLRMEEMRRNCVVRGPMGLLHKLILHFFFKDFFAGMFRLLADLAERRRNGTLPEIAPVGEPEQPSAWPVLVQAPGRPRESGRAEYRKLDDPWGEQPEMPPEINQPIAETEPCEKPGIEQPLRPRQVDNDCWLLWRGPGVLWTADAGFFGVDSKKWVFRGLDNCVHFVAI